MNALKQFGLGILWALLFPFLLVIYALIGVFGVFNFFYQFVMMIVHFFQGKKLFPPLEEDEKAYAILKRAHQQQTQPPEPAPAPQPTQVYVQQNYYQVPPGAYPPGVFPNQGGPAIPGSNPTPLPGSNPTQIPQQGAYVDPNNPANPADNPGNNPFNGGDEQ